jgi:tRNA (mo5U34)-methyltransferase
MSHTSDIRTSDLQRAVSAIPHWFHSIDLGDGVITPGDKSPETHRAELETLPDLRGKSVLDVGAWDGFYTFAAERLGASRVVSLDHFVWSLDRRKATEIGSRWRDESLPLCPYEETDAWRPDTLPGKRGYDLAHKVLGSRAEWVIEDFLEANLGETFDVVLFMGIVYHMKNPLAALEKACSFTKHVAVIESHAMESACFEGRALAEFFERDELAGDFSNWWVFNEKALVGMCRAAGFRRVEVARGYPTNPPSAPAAGHYRLVLHAWK